MKPSPCRRPTSRWKFDPVDELIKFSGIHYTLYWINSSGSPQTCKAGFSNVYHLRDIEHRLFYQNNEKEKSHCFKFIKNYMRIEKPSAQCNLLCCLIQNISKHSNQPVIWRSTIYFLSLCVYPFFCELNKIFSKDQRDHFC